MRVYLTGFMASGKTVLGRSLADELAYGFVDLDAAIEVRQGRSVRQIFREEGEERFRVMERLELGRTIAMRDHVVALGGGALLDANAMRWARANGTVVFLDVEIDEITRRLAGSGDQRPLVADALADPHPHGALRQRVEELMQRRRPAYERADVIFRPSGHSAAEDARMLAHLLTSRQVSRTGRSAGPDIPG